jgi:hypothetical protein
MRKLIVLTLSVFVAGSSLALAQGASGSGPASSGPANPTVPPSLSPDSRVTGSAPVGHAQPRRDAVPSENNLQESAEDRELNRKIKSICRGC